MTYFEWISSKYHTLESTLGKCKEACLLMQKDFPELKVTNGFVELAFVEEPVTHWWCVTQEGVIVDPTSFQYEANGSPIMSYEEISEEHPERLFEKRKCMNCGEYYYVTPELKFMHNEKCDSEFMEYLNGPEDRSNLC